ncbi:MAG: OsmC family protein [Phycisphaerales bacterium JB040]
MSTHPPEPPVLVSIGTTPYTCTVSAGGHEFVADEPEDLGGQDQGAGPYPLLLASLGTCKAITCTMYARRKQWPLEGVHLALTHHRDGPPGRAPERIEIEIQFEGDLSDEQLERLAEIADRCPVHRTITGELTIATAHVRE